MSPTDAAVTSDPARDEKDLAAIYDGESDSAEEPVREVDHIAERQLCRKFDVRLMPVLAIMCTFPFPAFCKNAFELLRSSHEKSRSLQRTRQGQHRQCANSGPRRRYEVAKPSPMPQ
jgi:hypothetical protein